MVIKTQCFVESITQLFFIRYVVDDAKGEDALKNDVKVIRSTLAVGFGF